MRLLFRLIIGACAALTLAACHHPKPSPSIGAGNSYPVSNYIRGATSLGQSSANVI